MTRPILLALACALGMLPISSAAYAHQCKGLKPAHCSCKANQPGTFEVLAQITNHGACYNQFAPSGCINFCQGQVLAMLPAMKNSMIKYRFCHKRVVTMSYSAGSNPYAPFQSLSLTAC
jgi:hypothetical protein